MIKMLIPMSFRHEMDIILVLLYHHLLNQPATITFALFEERKLS